MINAGIFHLTRTLLNERLTQVSMVIDKYSNAHISSQTKEQIQQGISLLHDQNIILQKAADEEQLVDR